MIDDITRIPEDDITDAVEGRGRFVVFGYCISVLILTFRLKSGVYFLQEGESAWGKRLGFAAVSFLLGWWGFPFGIIYTMMAIVSCLQGGEDVTGQILDLLGQGHRAGGRIDAAGLANIFGRGRSSGQEGEGR
jgi:hypothetical protein